MGIPEERARAKDPAAPASIGYATRRPSRARTSKRIALACVAFTAATAAVALTTMKHRLPTTPPSKPAMGELGITPTTTPAKFDSTAVFDSQVRPVLATMATRNREAADRALAAIHNHFKNARLGVPGFAESIIGPLDNFKSLYLGSKGYVERWWYERDDLQPMADHVQWNYENHVTSGPKMKAAITAAMEQFQQDGACKTVTRRSRRSTPTFKRRRCQHP